MRLPRLLAATSLFALLMVVPDVHAQSDGGPCDELLPSSTAPGPTEPALVQAWLEIGLQDPSFDAESVRRWLRDIQHLQDADQLVELAFQPPSNVLGASVLDGYDELARVADALRQSERFSNTTFAAELKSALFRHFGEVDSAEAARRASTEERVVIRTPHSNIDVGESIQIPPLVIPPSPAFPTGRLIAITGYGTVVFSDLDGSSQYRVFVSGANFGSLTLLENGNILVVSASAGGTVFTPAGALVKHLVHPEIDQKIVPVPLDGGGYFLAGAEDGGRTSEACAVVISKDGKSVSVSQFPRNEFSSQPIKLRDGSIAATGERGDLFVFDPQGNLANLTPVKGWISQPPAQLADGTIVLVTDNGSVRFFDEGGNPKSSWIFFEKKVDLAEKPSSGPVPLPDGTVAIQTYDGLLTILDSNGSILAQGRLGESFGSTPQVLSDGSLLLEIGDSSGPGDQNEFVQVVRKGDRLRSKVLWKTTEMITSPLVRLKEDLFAAGTIEGNLLLFDGKLGLQSRLKLDGSLRMPTMLMPNGRLATGGSSGKIHLLDLEAALEGIPIDIGQ